VEDDVGEGPEEGDDEDDVEGAAGEQRAAAGGEDLDEVGEADVEAVLRAAGEERGGGADEERGDDEQADDDDRVGGVAIGRQGAPELWEQLAAAYAADEGEGASEREQAEEDKKRGWRGGGRRRAADIIEAALGDLGRVSWAGFAA
jgi:hypothetical protein